MPFNMGAPLPLGGPCCIACHKRSTDVQCDDDAGWIDIVEVSRRSRSGNFSIQAQVVALGSDANTTPECRVLLDGSEVLSGTGATVITAVHPHAVQAECAGDVSTTSGLHTFKLQARSTGSGPNGFTIHAGTNPGRENGWLLIETCEDDGSPTTDTSGSTVVHTVDPTFTDLKSITVSSASGKFLVEASVSGTTDSTLCTPRVRVLVDGSFINGLGAYGSSAANGSAGNPTSARVFDVVTLTPGSHTFKVQGSYNGTIPGGWTGTGTITVTPVCE